MAEIANSIPQVGPRETIVLVNGKGVAGAIPNDPQGIGGQYVFGGAYSFFLYLAAGAISVQLQVLASRPGDPEVYVNVGAAKTASDTAGTAVSLGATSKVRVLVTGTGATTDAYCTLTRIPA